MMEKQPLLTKLMVIEGSKNHRCKLTVLDQDPCGITVIACDMVDNVEHQMAITEEEVCHCHFDDDVVIYSTAFFLSIYCCHRLLLLFLFTR